MKLRIVLWIIGITGAVASCCAWRIEAITRSRAFRWGGCALLAGLLLLLRYPNGSARPGKPAPHHRGVHLVAAVRGLVRSFRISAGRRTPRLVDRAKVSSSFRGAAAAAKRKDYHEALLLYHQAAAEYPEDPDPRRCMAELFLEAGLPDDAIVSFRDAQKLVREPDDKLLLAFAIAETLAECKKDVPAAIRCLEDFLAKYPDVAGRPFAEQRLQKMRALLAEDCARKPSITS